MKNPFKRLYRYLFDLPPPVVVEVTAEDIDNGKKALLKECPIARAVGRTMPPNKSHVSIYSWGIRVYYVNTYEDYSIPRSAEKFIKNFDSGRPVSPFKFEMVLD